MQQLKITGGARIGTANATWPFAKFIVTQDRLELNVGILGNLVFKPEDIISIEPYQGLSSGLKINHRVEHYKNTVIFWTTKNPHMLIRQIQQIGFFDHSSDETSPQASETITEKQRQSGFPIRTPFAVAVIVIWNILFLSDFIQSDFEGFMPSKGAATATALLFLASLLTLVSKDQAKKCGDIDCLL